jgi:hypothetical protein
MTFQHPFSLKGIDRRLAPGQYEVVTDEQFIGELMFPDYRRAATLIFLPDDAYRPSSIVMINVDPADLAATHKRDQATVSSEPAAAQRRIP